MKQQYKDMFLKQEANRCLLCHEASCSSKCPKGFDPAGFVKAIKFDNLANLDDYLDPSVCATCDAPCEKECVHFDFPIRIKEMTECAEYKRVDIDDVDLSIDFLGVKCENPFFLSSSIVAGSYDMCAKALEEGWAGIVYKTVGKIQINETSPRFDATKKAPGNSMQGFRNLEQLSVHPLEEDMDALKRLKENYPTKVIVASLMGQNVEEWKELAIMAENAKVDLIELNFSCPHMTAKGVGSDTGQNPEVVKQYTEAVKSVVKVPVVAKMTPNISHMELPARAAVEGGADGLAAINTIKCISGINIDKTYDQVSPHQVHGKSAVSGYSGTAVKPIALRFIHDLKKCEDIKHIPVSGMGGIETWRDAAEFLALGCENIQVTTSVMEYGYRVVSGMIQGLKAFLKDNGYKTVRDFVGSAIDDFIPADKLDRETVIFPNIDKETCVGCGRCYLSCTDAGHQAIIFDKETKQVRINGKNCVGCHLCSLVCPTGAIKKANKRIIKK